MSKFKKWNKQRIKRARTLRFGPIVALALATISALAVIFVTHASVSNTPSSTTGSYLTKSDKAFYTTHTVQSDSRTFYIGDTIIMPDGLQIQVTKVQRHWQPLAAISASIAHIQDGDNPTGKETVLIWFHAKNVGVSHLVYSDSIFTLQVPSKSEQRVANLSSFISSDYGDYGVEPWLLPGESTNTFVPFLVTPDSTLTSFQYYIAPAANTSPLTRLTVLLQAPATYQPETYTFKADKTIIVGQ